ncbi:chordin-like isoform X3 [Watersipora subatra]|uniref:chordin-like isoform X3 n=1 Tax=Watersipora subatra TaxID=2589382 RepID=UPI00355B15C1
MEHSGKTKLFSTILMLLSLGLCLKYSSANKLEEIPLVADRQLESFSSNVGCEFGEARYDIDSQWHPILEPYGVMYCLKCSCEAVIKKGLLQQRGQVQCRRISHECPDVSHCSETAILPPNSCCKICPENEDDRLVSVVAPFGGQARLDPASPNNRRLEHQSGSASNGRSISSVLTGTGLATDLFVLLSETSNSTTVTVGKATLVLEQSVLRMTILLSRAVEIESLQLLDESGDSFYETASFTINYVEGKSKICLEWRDAFRFTEEIQSGSSRLVLTTTDQPDGFLSGTIRTITTEKLETFSTLFTDSQGLGYSGTLSMGVDTSTNSLVIRATVLAPSSTLSGKHPVSLEILRDRRVVYSDVQPLHFGSTAGEFTSTWDGLPIASLKQLARGRLTARLTLPGEVELSGAITTFHRCGGIKSLITGQDALPPYATMGVALAELNLTSSGSVHYKIEIKDIESRISEIAMETDRTTLAGSSRKITRLARDINDRMHITVEGVYDKTDATDIQLLLEGKLFINVVTRLRPTGALRGQILVVPTMQTDYLLMNERQTGMAAAAWCESPDCSLTCAMLVPRAATRRDSPTKAYLDYWNQQQLLATFSEKNLIQATVTQTEVQQIGSSLPTLRIVSEDSTLYGQASIPESCFEGSPDLVLPAADENSGPRVGWVNEPLKLPHKCSYDKKIYSDGESWKPDEDSLACVTCSCKRNKAQCHPVVCPPVDCDSPVMLPGECCPACPKPTDNTTDSCFFPGDHRNHAVGTVWHPFMHPGGYFKCAICYCKDGGDGYDCRQTTCSTLSCPEYRQETLPGECCPSCRGISVIRPTVDLSRMQGDSDSYSSCSIGDRQYANGESFNPQIGSLGVFGNVLCTCRNGKLDCNTITCDCSKKMARKHRCCMKKCGFTEEDMIRKRRRKEKNKDRDLIC